MQDVTSIVDLARLSLSYGEGARLDVPVRPDRLDLGGQEYRTEPPEPGARLEISRTSAGYAMRLRFPARVEGPCVRCLAPAAIEIEVDAREVEHPEAGDEELRSPYVESHRLDVGQWAHDAVLLELPEQPVCRPDCAGLCPVCGESLNDADPEHHRHDSGGDPRWEKLRELQSE